VQSCGGAIHPFNQVEIDKGSAENNKNKPGPAPAVKENTGNQDNNVLEFFWNKVINKQKCR